MVCACLQSVSRQLYLAPSCDLPGSKPADTITDKALLDPTNMRPSLRELTVSERTPHAELLAGSDKAVVEANHAQVWLWHTDCVLSLFAQTADLTNLPDNLEHVLACQAAHCKALAVLAKVSKPMTVSHSIIMPRSSTAQSDRRVAAMHACMFMLPKHCITQYANTCCHTIVSLC